MGRVVIGVDGGRASAWGWAQDGGLAACGLFIVKDNRPLSLPYVKGAVCWVEFPIDYGQDREVDPNDLIKLGSRVGRVQEKLLGWENEVHLVLPRVWKGGSIPKRIHHPRIQASLTPSERKIVDAYMAPIAPSLRHNVWDAIGITLYGARKIGERS